MAQGGLFGILSERTLPDDGFVDLWDRIVVPSEVKQRALNFVLFSLLGRAQLSNVSVPVHGILLLQGPPGTGKTTLAHGIADKASRRAEELIGRQTMFAELDCHGIGSGVLGETPKHMDRIFEVSIPDLARSGAPPASCSTRSRTSRWHAVRHRSKRTRWMCIARPTRS